MLKLRKKHTTKMSIANYNHTCNLRMIANLGIYRYSYWGE